MRFNRPNLREKYPWLYAATLFFASAVSGLPFLAGFASLFPLLAGSFALAPWWTVALAPALLGNPWTLLNARHALFSQGVSQSVASQALSLHSAEIEHRRFSLLELWVLLPLAVLIIWIGLTPDTFYFLIWPAAAGFAHFKIEF